MGAKQFPKKIKKGQPPPVDKLILPAIGLGLALLAYQFYRGLNSEIPRVNVHDELDLRNVLFGEGGSGKSFAVLCHDDNHSSTLPISSVFTDAHNDGSAPAEFRLLDCNYVLPASGKSIAERFHLDLKLRPTIFLSGARVEQPTQVPAPHLKTGALLVKYVRNKLAVRAAPIATTQDLRSKCLDKDICALFLKGGKTAPPWLKSATQNLLKEFPNVAFAAIDSSVLYLLNLEEHLEELQNNTPRFVVFKKVSGSTAVGQGRLVTSIATLDPDTSPTYLSMSTLIANVVRGSQATVKIPSLPVVKTRTKKLEEQEREKRHRKLQQKMRASTSQSNTASSSSSSFDSNDGSRDGRKAERDRRRAEHHANQNVKPKTPEEMAEMERRRRARMEEEAAKWNMRPDDAPEEGDLVDETADHEYYDDQDDDLARTSVKDGAVDDDDDNDEEDVIDLD